MPTRKRKESAQGEDKPKAPKKKETLDGQPIIISGGSPIRIIGPRRNNSGGGNQHFQCVIPGNLNLTRIVIQNDAGENEYQAGENAIISIYFESE